MPATKLKSKKTIADPIMQPATSKLFDNTTVVNTDKSAEKLMNECGAIKVAWSWFRTGIKVDKNTKSAMASAAGTTDAGFSANKRLMDSKHPIIKEANELRNRVSSYIRGMSLPVTKLGDTDGKGKKEGGTYLVRRNDLADFESRMATFQSELSTMEDKLNASMESIKLADSQRLGDLYRSVDYPTNVQIRMRFYAVNLEPPAYLEKFAPKLFEQAKQAAEVWWQGVYDNAAMELMTEFRDVVSSWAEVLGPVTYIYPEDTHECAAYHGAEVRRRITHKEDSDIPDNKFIVIVRYRNPADKTEHIEKEIGPLTENEYQSLRPSEKVDKHRTFKNSTIENLLDVISKIRKMSNTISADVDFVGMVDQVEAEVKKAGQKPAEIGDELRKSKVVRGGIHALMQQVSDKMSGAIVSFTKKRRKVDINLLSDLE